MANKAYSLEGDEVVSRDVTAEELAAARTAAKAKLRADEPGFAIRSCWNCNSAHRRFLEDLNDGFLFYCVMGCGRWYYQGMDITEEDDEQTDAA